MYIWPSKAFEKKSAAHFSIIANQSLYDIQGRRKYVTELERETALVVARTRRAEIYTLFATLAFTGCRLSEALELDPTRVDFEQVALIFRTLKRNDKQTYRVVPVPNRLLAELDETHAVRRHQTQTTADDPRFWPLSRTHAWRLIKAILSEAGVKGAAGSPKGLRHGFGVTAVTKGVPLHLVQRWLGHTQMATTAIYADALGDEERLINTRMWTVVDRASP